jgi:multidrug resistance protein MdtO
MSLWLHKLWQDLQPTPGRLNSTLRIVLASMLTLVSLLVLQTPFASLGLYYVFLVGRDSPAISFRSSLVSLLTLAFTVATELAVVILSDNDPMMRLLSVAVVTFIAGMFMVASTLPALASTWGFIFCTLIALWENDAPSGALVNGSLWIIAVISIAVGWSVAIEYVFRSRHPAEQLAEQVRTRYVAVQQMFMVYAQEPGPTGIPDEALRVMRLAAAGQGGMQQLYNTIVDRNLDPGGLAIGSRVRITMQAQLMDQAAAFASAQVAHTEALRQRCARIAEDCGRLAEHMAPNPERIKMPEEGAAIAILDHVEETVGTLFSMPRMKDLEGDKALISLPAKDVPLLVPGALRSPDTVAFALKLSLCTTLCYIIYHAVDWPGISTAVLTVIITALSTSGAMKQKLLYRLIGSIIGGLVLGLGCTAFVFPYMDSITPLVILVGIVAFVSAWWAAGRRFNYIGLQIAFSFYLVAFEGFSAPTELAPARDRLIGILLALVVMWFVFDQIWPVRTVTAMRRAFASILRSEASFLRLFETAKNNRKILRRVDAIRDQIGKTMAGIRTMNEAVEYEFGVDRAAHGRSAQTIIQAGLAAVALFWNQLAVLHRDEDQDFIDEPGLIAMRHKLAENLEAMADSVCERKAFDEKNADGLVDEGLFESARYGQYARNSVSRYQDLRELIRALSVQV